MVTIDPNNLQNLVQRQIFFDPGDGQINLRIMLGIVQIVMASDLDDKKKSEVFDLVLVTALKLTAIYQHKDRCNRLEDELIVAAKAKPIEEGKNEPQRYATAQSLYLELDGLLVQFKSTLDHMVHILHFSYGLPFEALTTFGDNGNKIRTQLTRNVGGINKRPAAQLADFIEKHQEWLKGVIDLRDRMNHYKSGGISTHNFTVFVHKKKDGSEVLYTPKLTEELTVRDMMEHQYQNLVDFVEHFMGFAMLPKLSRFGLYYKIKEDKKETRWSLVPIELLRPHAHEAKPM